MTLLRILASALSTFVHGVDNGDDGAEVWGRKNFDGCKRSDLWSCSVLDTFEMVRDANYL